MSLFALHRRCANDEAVFTAVDFPSDRLGPWLSAVVDVSFDGVLIIDDTGQIMLANAQAGRLFDEPVQQLPNQSFDVFLSPQERIAHRAMLRHLSDRRPERRRPRIRTMLQCLRKNGDTFYCETQITCVTLCGTVYFSMIVRAARLPSRPSTNPNSEADSRRRAASSHHNHEIEKRRLSRVLYDDLGQTLGVLKLDMDDLQQSLRESNSAVTSRISGMQSTLDGALSRVKSIASALRPPLLDDFGLIPALLWVTADFQKKSGIRCVLKRHNTAFDVDEQVESAVFRLVQESLANIERHAKATDVQIFLWQSDRSLDVLVHDDGVGILRGAAGKPGCYGLLAMQERIATLDGTISINNIEPHGLAIHASIPVLSE